MRHSSRSDSNTSQNEAIDSGEWERDLWKEESKGAFKMTIIVLIEPSHTFGLQVSRARKLYHCDKVCESIMCTIQLYYGLVQAEIMYTRNGYAYTLSLVQVCVM